MTAHVGYLRRPQVLLLSLAVAVVLLLEGMLVWTYVELRAATQTHAREAFVPLNLANAQREALLLNGAALKRPGEGTDGVEPEIRIALLQNHLEVTRASAAAAGDTEGARELARVADLADAYGTMVARADAAGTASTPRASRALAAASEELALETRRLYDRAEHRSQVVVARTFETQRRAGAALLVIGAALLLVGGLSAVSLRRRIGGALTQLAAFPELNPEPLLRFNHDGTLSYANPAARRLAAEHADGDSAALLPPDYREAVAAALATHAVERREQQVGDRLVVWTFFPVGRSVVHCYGHDLTDRNALEQQLRQAQRLEAVGHLAGGIAHDFNNLLTVMSGYTALALDVDEEDPAERRRNLVEVEHACVRATSLTQQLLAFSRRQVLEARAVDVNGVVRGFDALLRRLVGEEIAIETTLDASPLTAVVDSGQLEQVLMNLAVNARDAMPAGGELRIATTPARLDEATAAAWETAPGDYVRISVSDNGDGMDEHTRANAFEPFFTTKEVGQGTGLGLSTVYGIVAQSGGAIRLDSTPGGGTTVELLLPVAAAESAPAPPAADVEAMSTGGSERIVVVEDEDVLRALVTKILGSHGYDVVAFAAPEDALASDDAADAVLLVTDVVMPGMNGRELAERLTQRNRELEVLFMSGYTRDVVIHRGVDDGSDAFLQKPFTGDELAGTVRMLLDRAARHASARAA